ncbi:MAG: SulP family inorganic anion transporter [Bacteroidetes bacterium]|nr:MAG: SulP family inorganic anion transporter [Bacteroidota bacterium]
MSGARLQNWTFVKKDSLPALLVGPVSLMFAIGLSLVAHAPIEAGVIAVVIGGFMVSAFGGAYVNISGPGVHSAAAWMMGALILGGGSLDRGYFMMLAAGAISGALIMAVGLTRQVHRFDIIPIAVRRGIVALLGVWIIIGQIPLLFGAEPFYDYHSIGEIISKYPYFLNRAVDGITDYWISGLGLTALVFMIIYSSYQNRLIRMLPAPIWLLFGGIALAGYLRINEGAGYVASLHEQVHFHEGVMEWFHRANFSMIGTWNFWSVVLGFTLVSLNESVTNLRATDRLDVQHRRSDINTELTALGLASVFSCLLGGLNVTATIAQSSTNVQLGATSRFSNLNNVLVVLLLMLLASPIVEELLVPAVAAMMVYIGYRMAAPSHLRSVAEIGWEDFVGWAVAFGLGWKFGLLYGILGGVLTMILLQLLTSGKFGHILRFLFRPNTLLYQEDDNSYLLSIKHYGSFLNLGRVREKIDTVPSSAEMIVDCSLAEFVDQNVLIQLEYYEELFMRRGGRFEVVGVDDLPVKVHHPFASWMPFGEAPSDTGPLSNRQEALAEWAEENGYSYHPGVLYTGQPYYRFQYFKTVRIEGQRNRLVGEVAGLNFIMADVDYFQGEFIARGSTHSTMMYIQTEVQLPQFVLDRERLLDRVASFAGFSDINFDEHPTFSSKFKLQGSNEKAIREFFSKDLIELHLANPEYHLEARGNQVLIFEKERLAGANEMKGMVSFAEKLAVFLKNAEE